MSVIANTAKILRLISDNEPCSLNFLTQALGMKKPTLFLTLKSLVEVGYLTKGPDNLYALGPVLLAVTAKRAAKADLTRLVKEAATALRDKSGETVVASTIENIYYEKILSVTSTQIVTINEAAFSLQTFYTGATGRITLAIAPTNLREKIIDALGLPNEREWSGVSTIERLRQELDSLKRAGVAEMTNSNGEAVFVAVPVVVGDRIIGLGLSVPKFRYVPSHQTACIAHARATAADLADKIARAR